MKKVLLLSLSLALGFSAFAQQRVAKADRQVFKADKNKVLVGKETVAPSAAQFAPQTAKSVVMNRYQDELEYTNAMETTYDLQSNSFCSNRMYQLPDGSVGTVATFSHEANLSASDRGTGYNFYKDGEWLDMPEARVEEFRTGWPTIAQWGETGEILLCHGDGHLQCFTREVAGEGEWVNMGPLPDCPEDYPYNEYATWPRVTTSGDNHNIIHVVACLQHTGVGTSDVLYRSEDAVNWEISYGPLEELGYHENYFSADDYAVASNGHTVAILYCGAMDNSVWLAKSTDDGLTWNTRRVWEDPYEAQEDVLYDQPLYRPMNGSVVVDKDGVVHVALNSFRMTYDQDNLDNGTFSYWAGLTVDGIAYWNDTQAGPIESEDGNPHNALCLWMDNPDDTSTVLRSSDTIKWIGFVPRFVGVDWANAKYYYGSDYLQRIWGASGHPALSCDPEGNLACAFTTPFMIQEDDSYPYYKRHIIVSYRNVDEGYWRQDWDDITDPEAIFELSESDNIFTVAVPNTVNPGEFWFGFMSDYEVGLYWGSSDDFTSNQIAATDNGIFAIKVIADEETVSVPESTEAVDVIYGIYPNPATDYVIVKSAMDTEANISIFNLVGQNVKSFSKTLKDGENAISIDLQSGIYFCNIEANGFTKTIKFVVK